MLASGSLTRSVLHPPDQRICFYYFTDKKLRLRNAQDLSKVAWSVNVRAGI